MNRAVVCVATTERYRRGMMRLAGEVERQELATMLTYEHEPEGCPTHQERPYAFKAWAMMDAARRNYTTLLWCDACILPIRDMEPLFQRIERDGVWLSRNGWNNYEWTADSAYPLLFPKVSIEEARETNRKIPHVVATAFGVNTQHPKGRIFLAEYSRLAQTSAFCGPWANTALVVETMRGGLPEPCGPIDVRGHRHDQTAASVLAWRLDVPLTDPPEVFSYPPGDERTILLADGAYE